MESQVLKEVILKRRQIPKMIADLSFTDETKAIKYMRIFANKEMPVTPLYDQLSNELKKERVG